MRLISLKVDERILERVDAEAASRDMSRTALLLERWKDFVQAPVIGDALELVKPKRPAAQPASKTPPKTAPKPSSGWYPHNKCPHGWQNSFLCRDHNGGCVSPNDAQ